VESRENINQDLISGLNSPDENTVAETLKELRIRGNIDVLPSVFRLLFSKRMESLDFEIVSLINDIKDPLAVPVFMEAVRKYKGKKDFDQLVSACWQCGLDFSPHIDQFINLVIEEDYYTSLEAFSVIEENISLLSSQQRTARLEFIRSKLDILSPEKRLLVNEMMSLISNISGPFRLATDNLN
jgi:hypothetical protein